MLTLIDLIEHQDIHFAGQGDKMVQAILKGIPKESRESGIATEVSLKDRFDVVSYSCKFKNYY